MINRYKYIFLSGIFTFLLVLITSCTAFKPGIINENSSEKVGEASYTVVLGIFRPMHADISIRKAAENGGITKISTVDFVVEYNPFSKTYKTIVTGE